MQFVYYYDIPSSPAYGVYMSHNSFDTLENVLHMINFLSRGKLLTNKLVFSTFESFISLKAAYHKFYGRYNDVVCP